MSVMLESLAEPLSELAMAVKLSQSSKPTKIRLEKF